MKARATRQELERIREGFRIRGYDDGRQGKPARYTLAEYQVSYRRGREAREAAERGDVA